MSRLLAAAGLAGFFIVTLGAFGAHGLEGRLTVEARAWWETATVYGLVHAVAAMALALGDSAPKRAAWAFLFGVILFSGSLYLMASGAPRALGMITPIGGVSFLVGWALVIVHSRTRMKR